MFEDKAIVDRFIQAWRKSGKQVRPVYFVLHVTVTLCSGWVTCMADMSNMKMSHWVLGLLWLQFMNQLRLVVTMIILVVS